MELPQELDPTLVGRIESLDKVRQHLSALPGRRQRGIMDLTKIKAGSMPVVHG